MYSRSVTGFSGAQLTVLALHFNLISKMIHRKYCDVSKRKTCLQTLTPCLNWGHNERMRRHHNYNLCMSWGSVERIYVEKSYLKRMKQPSKTVQRNMHGRCRPCAERRKVPDVNIDIRVRLLQGLVKQHEEHLGATYIEVFSKFIVRSCYAMAEN